jgi:hypothetical protein
LALIYFHESRRNFASENRAGRRSQIAEARERGIPEKWRTECHKYHARAIIEAQRRGRKRNPLKERHFCRVIDIECPTARVETFLMLQ